ncbi:MAG: hypothetical protein JRH11_15655 [Deltaproteobacteria bacterium]|nr:hypothetical protein [Deltaproteobacteria bacterium]
MVTFAGCGDDGGTPPLTDSGTLTDAGRDSARPDTGSCSSGLTSCGGGCVNTRTDLDNCGTCGNRCALDESCSSGSCETMISCGDGESDCGDGCIDVQADNANCGTCGRACGPDEMCMAGSCAAASCTTGETRCGAACVDTMTDDANCGACDAACDDGESCEDGTCSDACPAPRMICGSGAEAVCADLNTDMANCGTCGTACPADQICAGGRCDCTAGTELCGGACVDTMTDTANCGSCGAPCGAGTTCVGGACTCPAPSTLCGGSCTLTDIDSANCGTCGNICSGGTPTCVSGSCMASTCGTGEIPCGASCVDPLTDNANCGGCGTACGATTLCATGLCRPRNDLRAMAETVTLDAAEVTVMGTTTDATKDGPASGSECRGCTGGGNVWYSVTLAEDGVLYADTQGAPFDTKLFLTDSAGATVTAGAGEDWCQDDHSCGSAPGWGTRDARIYGWLRADTYLISVGGCATGDFSLHLQFMASTGASIFYSEPLRDDDVTDSTFLVGASVTAGSCGGASSGEDARWFVTCGGQPQTFSLCRSDSIGFIFRTRPEYERTDGSVNYDPRMYTRSAQTGLQVTCNDDGSSMGASDCRGYDSTMSTSDYVDGFEYGSRINGVVIPRGVGAVFVDSSSGGSGMNYRLLHRVQDAP